MADGSPVRIPIYAGRETLDSAILSMEIARVVIDGDTLVVDADIRLAAADSAAAVAIMEIPNQTYLYDVGWRVVTVFDTGTNISIGDCDDADGWASSANVAATVADTDISWAGETALSVLHTYTEAVEAQVAARDATSDLPASTTAPPSAVTIPVYGFSGGKYIGGDTTVADTFSITLTIGTVDAAGPSSGSLEVYAKFARVWGRNRRLGTAAEGATT